MFIYAYAFIRIVMLVGGGLAVALPIMQAVADKGGAISKAISKEETYVYTYIYICIYMYIYTYIYL